MSTALLYKEFRETLPIAAVGLACLLFVALNAMGYAPIDYVLSGNAQGAIPFMEWGDNFEGNFRMFAGQVDRFGAFGNGTARSHRRDLAAIEYERAFFDHRSADRMDRGVGYCNRLLLWRTRNLRIGRQAGNHTGDHEHRRDGR